MTIPDVNFTLQSLGKANFFSVIDLKSGTANMKISNEKSNFFKNSVEHLGHIVLYEKITVDPLEIETFLDSWVTTEDSYKILHKLRNR